MSTFSRLKSTFQQATASTTGALGIAIPLVMIPAAIYGFADVEIMSDLNQQAQKAQALAGQGGAPNYDQGLLITAMLQLTGLDILLELIFGPIIAAGAIYTVATRRDGRSPTLYGAINFALSRYRRLFLWHAAAQLSIKLGMLALVPGVLFMMMYAMVDPVLCFEKERWPLDRSKRLTRAWRKTLFLFMLPWVVLVAVIPLLLFWSSSQGTLITLVFSVLYYLSLFWLQAGFGWLYLERLDAGRQASRAREEASQSASASPESSTPVAASESLPAGPAPPAAGSTVQPMGVGQKIGLTLVALAVLGLVVSWISAEEPPAMNPASLTGQDPAVEPAVPDPDAIEGGTELPAQ